MTVTTYPEDDGRGAALEPKTEFLVDPADGKRKRWLSLGYVTAGRLKLMPADMWGGVRVYWQLPQNDSDGGMSEELYQLMQTARALEDLARLRRLKPEYSLESASLSTRVNVGLLTTDTYLVTDRRGGGQELWVQGWKKPDDLLLRVRLTPGQTALLGELLRLPPYEEDGRNAVAIAEAVHDFSDDVLKAVANRLLSRIRAEAVTERPYLGDIREMCAEVVKELEASKQPDTRTKLTRPFR